MAILCAESLPSPKAEVAEYLEFAKCDCCGLTEECTPEYIFKVRERYEGHWICGLCSEAVKDEMCRSERSIRMEEAVDRHMSFCKKFSSAPAPEDSAELLISAMRQLLRRSFGSPRSAPGSPLRRGESSRKLARAGSCFSRVEG